MLKRNSADVINTELYAMSARNTKRHTSNLLRRRFKNVRKKSVYKNVFVCIKNVFNRGTKDMSLCITHLHSQTL